MVLIFASQPVNGRSTQPHFLVRVPERLLTDPFVGQFELAPDEVAMFSWRRMTDDGWHIRAAFLVTEQLDEYGAAGLDRFAGQKSDSFVRGIMQGGAHVNAVVQDGQRPGAVVSASGSPAMHRIAFAPAARGIRKTLDFGSDQIDGTKFYCGGHSCPRIWIYNSSRVDAKPGIDVR